MTGMRSTVLFAPSKERVNFRAKLEKLILPWNISLDGEGKTDISTGLGFFDHMLDQLGRHGGMDLMVAVKGDLHVDEHHTIEDTAITLGEAFREALGDKRGIERYAFTLPMDDALVTVALDLGGRPWIEWDVSI